MVTEPKGAAAVYAPWATFKTAIERLSQGVPNQIDRTVFTGMAWSVQSQVLAGLKFLGLTDDKGKPTPALHKIAVKDEGARKEALKGVLTARYGDLVALDLTKATLHQLNEQMTASYSVTGETREKAVRFFLSAAEYAGMPLSSYLKPQNGAGTSGPTPRKRRVAARPKVTTPPPTTTNTPSTNGTTRTVGLKSGGAITLTVSIDVLRLMKTDREFVFGLIDQLDGYEAENASDDTDEEGADDTGSEQ